MSERIQAAAEDLFATGFDFHWFIMSSHCYDGRDICRFFMLDDSPQWVRDSISAYEKSISIGAGRDAGITAARKVLVAAATCELSRLVAEETAELNAKAQDLEMRKDDAELRIHQLEGECGHLQADKAALRAKLEGAEKEIELQRELFRREIERGNVAEARVEAAMGAAEDLERRAAALKQSDNEIAIATCNGLSSAAHQLRAALSTSEPSVGLSG